MRLMIVGSLTDQLGTAARIAIDNGAKVVHAENIDIAMRCSRSGQGADLILADVRQDIGQLIEQLKSERIVVPVVACGIGTDSRTAVAAIKAGAREFLPLPPDPELIAAILAAVTEGNHAVVHADPRMSEVLALADRVAGSDASVLITGSSGSGKEVIARYLHARSRRANARFVAVNCAAIPEALLESELFGHEKGAFTGAIARRIGRFEEANGGTLLLDEVSEMDPRLQAKLLRAVQEREIDRVGGSQPVKIDVRILATSNRDMMEAVRQGTFRGDLYYRLNVVGLQIPALRERPRDIPVLARHFAARHAEANGFDAPEIAADAERQLLAHAWPGNVRELDNVMHRAVLLAAGGRIGADAIRLDSPATSAAGGSGGAGTMTAGGIPGLVGRTVADVERDLILDTLRHCLGNRTQAATILGISIRTMRNKLRQYSDEGVAVPPPGAGETREEEMVGRSAMIGAYVHG